MLCPQQEKIFRIRTDIGCEKSCEARGRIRVCERWDSTLVQTTRTNRMMPESEIFGVVFIKKEKGNGSCPYS